MLKTVLDLFVINLRLKSNNMWKFNLLKIFNDWVIMPLWLMLLIGLTVNLFTGKWLTSLFALVSMFFLGIIGGLLKRDIERLSIGRNQNDKLYISAWEVEMKYRYFTRKALFSAFFRTVVFILVCFFIDSHAKWNGEWGQLLLFSFVISLFYTVIAFLIGCGFSYLIGKNLKLKP